MIKQISTSMLFLSAYCLDRNIAVIKENPDLPRIAPFDVRSKCRFTLFSIRVSIIERVDGTAEMMALILLKLCSPPLVGNAHSVHKRPNTPLIASLRSSNNISELVAGIGDG